VDYIVLAIPVFLLLIGIELAAVRIAGRGDYRLADSVNDLSCGLLQQLVELFLKTALFAGYAFVYARFRLTTLPAASVLAWSACFVGVEFCYYWFHRMSHEVNAIWATHVVHHQSEDFNLAVALRQGAFQGSISWVFYLPLAWIGFPPAMFLTVVSISTLYQFWIHTQLIGRLGPLEWVLNTPSHHRVHHGRNPRYIDRNHGGTLIVWDRLFGTFQAEEEAPVYGITKPLASWNPVWANVHYWVELARMAAGAPAVADKLRVFTKPPGWRPAPLGGFQEAPAVDAGSYRKWESPTTPSWSLYASLQFALTLGAATVMLFRQQSLSRGTLALGAALVLASLVIVGGFLERKRWAVPAEGIRLLALAGVFAFWRLV
jgi:sterol desaturase/sphingolipid hydroxylase (fatty acid hydroxylase superfamily)